LTGLNYLDLASNDFIGTLPSEIGLLTSLIDLNLENNDFTGTIPSEIGLLTGLNFFSLSNNLLSGSIPSEVEALDFYYLENVANQKAGKLLTPSNQTIIII